MQNSNQRTSPYVVLGLDVGDSRIGVARAHSIARLPEPLTTIDRIKNNPLTVLQDLIQATDARLIVIGLPISLNGTINEQATKVQLFSQQLAASISTPIVFVNEAYSSKDADMYIKSKGLTQSSNDAIAACVILERYFEQEG